MGILSWALGRGKGLPHAESCFACARLEQLRQDMDVVELIEFLHSGPADHRERAAAVLKAVTGKDLWLRRRAGKVWWRMQKGHPELG
jgi:hypothetical protein